jgi:GntR family transcriptional regulator
MPWDIQTDRPIYIQLMEQIQLKICSGIYPPGSRLPSVRDLAQEASVNPNTMQRALAELEAAGFCTQTAQAADL